MALAIMGSSGNSAMRRPNLVSSPLSFKEKELHHARASRLACGGDPPRATGSKRSTAEKKHKKKKETKEKERKPVVERCERVQLLQRPQQRLRRRRVHEVEVH